MRNLSPARRRSGGTDAGTAARRAGARFRRLYGASPPHLVILLASFAVCGYAALRWLTDDWLSIAVWFVGAAVLHDLVLVPLYAGADWIVSRLLGLAARGSRTTPRTAVNHLRVPAFVSLLLLLVYWPLILGDSPHYAVSTHLSGTVFLGRWLLITAALFGASALWFALARWRSRPRTRIPTKEH
ncbi:hypothetical protein [Streptomyces sp. NBC_01497]|uniref:hypothetical protein n=1 Tax=Streptomyces sp. NBC_01497 TaxID=2903885 RepID=UPI002E33526E|nr:hypothetical protein [Streptomyces sp. NBC_01497]